MRDDLSQDVVIPFIGLDLLVAPHLIDNALSESKGDRDEVEGEDEDEDGDSSLSEVEI